jgi:hypothetical protein
MTYAASIWFTPKGGDPNHRFSLVQRLEAIQKRAAKLITGAFKTVAGSALDIEAFPPCPHIPRAEYS